MPARAPSDPDTAMALGEIRGQLRELIHNQNNHTMKADAMAEKVTRLGSLPEDIAEIKGDLNDIKDRLTVLETDKHRRDGAMGFGAALARSPLLAWIFAAAVVAWTWFKDRA